MSATENLTKELDLAGYEMELNDAVSVIEYRYFFICLLPDLHVEGDYWVARFAKGVDGKGGDWDEGTLHVGKIGECQAYMDVFKRKVN